MNAQISNAADPLVIDESACRAYMREIREILGVDLFAMVVDGPSILLDGIERIAKNMGRVAGLPEDRLPEVLISNKELTPPTVNDPELARRLRGAWMESMGEETVIEVPTKGMGAEDFPFFTVDPEITSVYWAIGGTPQEDFDREAAGGEPVPSHHSPLFKIAPEPAVRAGVESTVVALMELMGT